MITPITVASWQLLKHIHITELEIVVFVYVISKAGKKAILIKIIIDNLPAKVDMHFIIEYQRKRSGLKMLFT